MRTCGATGVPPWGTHGPGGVVLTDLQSLLDVNKLLSLSLSLCLALVFIITPIQIIPHVTSPG